MIATQDLIRQTRNDLMEFDTNVLPDSTICERLHRGYIEILKTLNKTHSHFLREWQEVTVPLTGYSLHQLLGRGVESVCYQNISLKRIEPYERPKIERLGGTPFVFTVEAGKLFVLPPKEVTVRILTSPRVLPLAPAVGRISRIQGNKIWLDTEPSSEALQYFEEAFEPKLSVTDWNTGITKRLYLVGNVNGNEITLIESTQEQYLGYPITSVAVTDLLEGDTELQANDVVTCGLSSGVPLIPDDLTHYMVAWATLATRGAYNESDEVLREMMTQLTKDIHSEAANIPQVGKIRREFGKVNAYLPYRRA